MNIKEKLQESRPVLGSWLNTASPVVAELMATSGFDFLTVDVEHSPVDLPQAQSLFQAIKAGSAACAPLVRLAGNCYADNKRFLDAGASGVIAPLINNAEQASAGPTAMAGI
jgi:2-keto-3-deoxy-L-rhamnonate aldolase RhmA